MNLRGHLMSQKRTLKTWGRRGRGQIKNACAQDQKGEEWGAAQQPSSEGRERRRRRAEDVGVVLGEAARVRDVGLLRSDRPRPFRRRFARKPRTAYRRHCVAKYERGRLRYRGDLSVFFNIRNSRS